LVTGEPVNGVYKLVDIDGIPVMKEASGKITYPGRKQIFRAADYAQDTLGLMAEAPPAHTQPLLKQVMHNGQQLSPPEDLSAIAQRTAHSVQRLPDTSRVITNPQPFPVHISPALADLTERTRRHHTPD
jgi:nicotinate phosphoribosyltransferase